MPQNSTGVKNFPREEKNVGGDHELESQEDDESENRPRRNRHPQERYGEWKHKDSDCFVDF